MFAARPGLTPITVPGTHESLLTHPAGLARDLLDAPDSKEVTNTVGTLVADGKPHEEFDGQTYVLERGIVADLALVHAHTADVEGNLRYRRTARNFNPLVATAGRVTVADAEVVLDGHLDPDDVMTPGIYVNHLVRSGDRPKEIEQRTVRPRPTAGQKA
ncbi:CoA transferase subunit A [Streptomyces sp. NPDC048253]|uniref:CoA transferase subunit A n=1 Tax=Streptomyces sp. NPDC048253 TaxID=3365524 RepID=UPI003717CBC3